MELNTFTPNFKKQATQRGCRELLRMADEIEYFGTRQYTAKELTKRLGNQSQPLGKWLRLGLVRHGSYSVTQKRAYSYSLNLDFITSVRSKVEQPKSTLLEVTKRLDFVFHPTRRTMMKRTGNRVYGWWVYTNSDIVKEVFLNQFGVMYKYDIEVSRPTIIAALYDKAVNPILVQHSTRHSIPHWRRYITHRAEVRQEMADAIGCTPLDIKKILQSVTNGGWASTSPKNPVCQRLGVPKTCLLLNHPMYIGMRQDYKTIRKVLKPSTPAKEASRTLYFAYEKYEDAIMTLIDRVLKIDAWFIHDGFFTHEPVNTTLLEAYIQNKLNITIKLEQTTEYLVQAL